MGVLILEVTKEDTTGQGGINSVQASNDISLSMAALNHHSCSGVLIDSDFNWRIITLQFCNDFCHTST